MGASRKFCGTFPTNYSTEFQNLAELRLTRGIRMGEGRERGSCRGRNSTKLFRLEWRAPFSGSHCRTVVLLIGLPRNGSVLLAKTSSPRPTVICLLLHRSVPPNFRLFPRSSIHYQTVRSLLQISWKKRKWNRKKDSVAGIKNLSSKSLLDRFQL